MTSIVRSYKTLLAVLVLAFPACIIAQEVVIPANLQAQLLMKVMEFDRSFKERVSDRVVLGIVYQSRNRESAIAATEFKKALEQQEPTPQGMTLTVLLVDYKDHEALEQRLKVDSIDLLYFTPLRSVLWDELALLAEQHHIVTLTGVPKYVETSVAVGIGMKDEKPQILVNLELAKTQGADFSSQLLKLAKIYGKQK